MGSRAEEDLLEDFPSFGGFKWIGLRRACDLICWDLKDSTIFPKFAHTHTSGRKKINFPKHDEMKNLLTYILLRGGDFSLMKTNTLQCRHTARGHNRLRVGGSHDKVCEKCSRSIDVDSKRRRNSFVDGHMMMSVIKVYHRCGGGKMLSKASFSSTCFIIHRVCVYVCVELFRKYLPDNEMKAAIELRFYLSFSLSHPKSSNLLCNSIRRWNKMLRHNRPTSTAIIMIYLFRYLRAACTKSTPDSRM